METSHAFFPHDCNAFGNVVCAVAVHFCTEAIRVRMTVHFFHFAGVVIHFGFYIGKAVDTGNDLSCVFAETVEDNAERFLTNFVCFFSNADCAFSSSEGFMASQEAEAFGFFFEQHFAEVAMAQAYFTLVSNGARDAECLQAFTDCSSSFRSFFAAFFDCDCTANDVSPASVFKADRPGFFSPGRRFPDRHLS